jgi:hypothetical protein
MDEREQKEINQLDVFERNRIKQIAARTARAYIGVEECLLEGYLLAYTQGEKPEYANVLNARIGTADVQAAHYFLAAYKQANQELLLADKRTATKSAVNTVLAVKKS